MPKQLHNHLSQDFVFVEVYETNWDNSSADGRRPEHYRVALPEVEDSKTFIKRRMESLSVFFVEALDPRLVGRLPSFVPGRFDALLGRLGCL